MPQSAFPSRPERDFESLSFMPPQSSSAAKARYAFDGIRAQIRDLHTETIANLAMRARELGDVIALWYGEGDMVTPAFIRDAAKAALDEGLTFYIPEHARPWPLERGAVGLSDAHARPAHPDRAHDRHAGRHAGALFRARAAGRYGHERRLCRAAMAEHPQRHPPDRRRAAPVRARLRRRLAARPRPAVCDLRRPHARDLPLDALQPDRLDGDARGDARAARLQPAHRHLDHLGRGLRPALFRRRRGARRSCRSPRMATGCCPSTASRRPGR